MIGSLEEFVGRIVAIDPAPDEVLLFRGHSDCAQFRLVPSVLREARLRGAEHAILRELVASHPAEFETDTSTLDKLARVQHYSLPTRLLDASWNPLVGLYFAAREHPEATGEVVVFRVKKDRVKSHDSDTASCIANLAQLSERDKQAIDCDLPPEAFNAQPPVDLLLQYVRMEKPYFQPRIVPEHLRKVLAIKPKLSNRRVIAQSGAFLLFGLGAEREAIPCEGIRVDRLAVPGEHKARICRELDRMTINDSTMFPEIEKAALYIRSKL